MYRYVDGVRYARDEVTLTSSSRPPFALPESAVDGPTFGQRLRDYRRAAGLTQGELAALARVSERTVLKLETGTGGVPRHSTVARLATALGLGDEARAAFLALAAGGRATRATTPHNFPAPRTAFIGRAGGQRAIARLLTGCIWHRLLTLVGPGGVGKTRLALQVAATLLPAFPDGIWFVDLVASAEATSVADAIATVIGLRDRPGQQTLDSLVAELRDRRTLLILDNCEQLRLPVAELATALLARTSGVQLLATSHEALGLPGEVARRVAPLALPEPGDTPPNVEIVLRSEAAQLFCARAAQADPDFAVTPANAATIAALCARLDGLPLLLELVAAQLSTRSLAALAGGLADTLRPLPARRRGGAARQRNVQALLDWSHALLTPAERILLRRLAPFAAGWTREAMRAVCGGPDLPDPDATLDRLVAQSLVVEERTTEHTPRYRLLETIRRDVHARLLVAGEADALAERHCRWCIALAESCADPLDDGPAGSAWLAALAPEIGNVRAAYEWADAHTPTLGLRLATACCPYAFIRMNHRAARARLERGGADDRLRASIVRGASTRRAERLQRSQSRTGRSDHRPRRGGGRYPARHRDSLAARVRRPRARHARRSGAPARCRPGARRRRSASGSPRPYAMMRGYFALARGDRDGGEATLRRADADAQVAEQPLCRRMILARLGQAVLLRGDPDGARATCATLLTVAETIGSSFYRFVGYHRLGMAEEWTGELDAADRAYAEARRFSSSGSGDSLDRATSFLWQARRAQTGMPQPRADAPRIARTEADLRALLTPNARAAARDPATAPTFEEALAEAGAWLYGES